MTWRGECDCAVCNTVRLCAGRWRLGCCCSSRLMTSGSLSCLHLPSGQRGSRTSSAAVGSRVSNIRAIAAARPMSPVEPGIAQADIETAIRVNGIALKLLAISMSPCHPRRTRGGPIGPGNTGSECEARPSSLIWSGGSLSSDVHRHHRGGPRIQILGVWWPRERGR